MPAEQPFAVLPLLEFRQFALALVLAYNAIKDESSKEEVKSLLDEFSTLQGFETVLWKLADAPTTK